MFLERVTAQLDNMSEAEKNQWILAQAKFIEESKQEDFLLSLSSEKKVINMPSHREIEAFCRKVESGEIYLEYEHQYFEFDENGKYMDNWKIWHNDPCGAMPFLDRVFEGCSDLLVLGEYKEAADILDSVCRLVFQVVLAPDSDAEDFENNTTFTIDGAVREGMLSRSNIEIGMDWITAVICREDKCDSFALAEKIVQLLELPLCKEVNPDMFMGNKFLIEKLNEELFLDMLKVLKKQIADAEEIWEKEYAIIHYSHEKFVFKEALIRRKALASNIEFKCLHDVDKYLQQSQTASVLAVAWKQICELIEQLLYESNLDNQWQVEEIKNMCSALIKRGRFDQEDWELRKKILKDIIGHEYYNRYSCSDSMLDLSEQLCFTAQEYLAFAEILDRSDTYKKKAAQLYRQYGREDKYLFYLETHLDRESDTYIDLIKCYEQLGRLDEARQVGEQGLENCRDNLTDIFIFLLKDARRYGDKTRFRKFYSSAKRRRGADIVLIDKALADAE